MKPIICDSIADFPPEKYHLLAYCTDCHRNPEIDREAIDPQTKREAPRAKPIGQNRTFVITKYGCEGAVFWI